MQLYTLYALLIISFPCLIIASYNGWLFAVDAKPLFIAILISFVCTWLIFIIGTQYSELYIYDFLYVIIFPIIHYIVRKKRNLPFSGFQFSILTGLGLPFFAILQFLIYLTILAIAFADFYKNH